MMACMRFFKILHSSLRFLQCEGIMLTSCFFACSLFVVVWIVHQKQLQKLFGSGQTVSMNQRNLNGKKNFHSNTKTYTNPKTKAKKCKKLTRPNPKHTKNTYTQTPIISKPPFSFKKLRTSSNTNHKNEQNKTTKPGHLYKTQTKIINLIKPSSFHAQRTNIARNFSSPAEWA